MLLFNAVVSMVAGRTYKATVNQMFQECDQDKNSVLDADEMLQCMEKEGTDVKDTDAHILRYKETAKT